MKDTLLNDKKKRETVKLIKAKNYAKVISILEKIKTNHAGTAKTKDKRFVISEIVRDILENSSEREKDFFIDGSFFIKRKEDVAKEIGVSLIWRGYKVNPKKVKEYLLKTADDGNWEVREYAGSAFAATVFHFPEFYKSLLKYAKSHSENVRRAVVIAATGLRYKENLSKAFSLFEVLLFDESKYVRKNLGPFILGSYFGNKYPAETLKQIKKWSKIRDENLRWNLIMAFNNSFGNKYPEEALEVLKLFTGDVDLTVKRAMNSTLNFLEKRHKKIVSEFRKKYNPET